MRTWTEASDRELVVAFQSGDDDAYDELYRRHIGRVRHVCRKFLADPQDAEEAAQETFLRSFQALGRFNGRYQVGAWLSRIASNVCLDQLRASQRHIRVVNLADDGVEELEDGTSPDASVPDKMELASTLKRIQPLHARALMLRTLEGLTHQEMAGELQMTPDQVKALLHRARTSFRRAWQKASGWALAPLAGMRSTLTQRSRETAAAGDGAAAGLITPSGQVMLEKMAASAVAAALAFSGTPSVPESDKPEGPPRAHSVAERAGITGAATPSTARPVPAASAEQGVAEEAPKDRLTRVLLAAPETIEEALEDEREEEEPRDDEPRDDDPTTGPTVTTKPVKDKADEVRKEIEDKAPRLP